MKNIFIGHFKKDDPEINDLWKTATFVFDANVLLNLYRYSEPTRNAFLDLFEKVGDRIWMPEQVGYEFLSNRPRVISEQSKAYTSAIESIEKLSASFSEERAHPFISPAAKAAYDKAADAIKNEMKENQAAQDKLLTDDNILDTLCELFEGKVGASYPTEKMSELFEEGEKRYADSIPPGYKDEKKFKSPQNFDEKRANFGDWILWAQILDHSKESENPVILVTNDTKEDWWLEQSGKTLGPRPELISEFHLKTKQHVLIYKPERFLGLGSKKLKAPVDRKTINEVEAERLARERHLEIASHSHRSSKNGSFYGKRFPPQSGEKSLLSSGGKSNFDQTSHVNRRLFNDEIFNVETALKKITSRIHELHLLFLEANDVGDKREINEIRQQLNDAFTMEDNLRERLNDLRIQYWNDPA